MVAALLGRDLLRARQQRQRIRDEASVLFLGAINTVEDVVVDDYKRAAGESLAALQSMGTWLAGLDGARDGNPEYEERLAEARTPLRRWARSAKPRLEHAVADLRRIRVAAGDLREPADMRLLTSEMIDAVLAYISAADAFIGFEYDEAESLLDKAHVAWRELQQRHGLANYR